MEIKNSTRFFIKKNGQINCRVKYGSHASGKMSQSIDFSIGYYAEQNKWDSANQCPLRGTTHKVGHKVSTASQISRAIADYNSTIADTIHFFEGNEYVPTSNEFKQIFAQKLVERGIKEEKPHQRQENELNDINKAWAQFIDEGVTLKGWQRNTTTKFITLQNHLNDFCNGLKVSDIDTPFLQKFQTYLTSKRSKKDGKPVHNSTINGEYKRMRWFLNWCKEQGLSIGEGAEEYNPKLKDTEDKQVIFLDYGEFMQLYNYQVPISKNYLQHTKDLYIFQCATGMRYSDLSKIKRSHIANGLIMFTTQKTTHSLTIKINRYAQEVLDKYADTIFQNDLALPPMSNQKMNQYLKELCEMVGIDKIVNIVYKSGGKRIEETHPKYELIGTHSARRTFVSVSLALGASAEQVQAVTGHHSYAVMKNYIGLSDADRHKATEVWNNDDAHKTKYIEHIKSFSLNTLMQLSKMSEQELLKLISK